MIFRPTAILLLTMMETLAFAADLSIHSMLVDARSLELNDNRQLTFHSDGPVFYPLISPDGKHILYGTGDSITVMRTDGTKKTAITADEDWSLTGTFAWAPDSRSFAVSAKHSARVAQAASPDGQPGAEDPYILTYSPDGKLKSAIEFKPQVEGTTPIVSQLAYSPDSTRLAVSSVTITEHSGSREVVHCVQVLDLTADPARAVFSTDKIKCNHLAGWTPDGAALLVCDRDQLSRHSLKTGELEHTIAFASSAAACSPDCRQVVRPEATGVAVENLDTKQVTRVTSSVDACFTRWTPDSRMLLYTRPSSVRDDSNKRSRDLNTLWLASVTDSPTNSLCVALDADPHSVTISSDCTRIAYTSQDRLYVAELEWRDTTPREKVGAGFALTEEEEKQALIEQARQIGTAVEQCLMDSKSELPQSLEDLQNYAGDKAFMRPGRNQMIFKFISPENPWTTDAEGRRQMAEDVIIGEYDSGYAWKVVVYIDGDAKVVEK